MEDAPDGVHEAIEHIQTAMSLVSDPGVPLNEAQPETLELQQAVSVVSQLGADDWSVIGESEFVDVAHSSIMTNQRSFSNTTSSGYTASVGEMPVRHSR